ncbi:hypothetical protein [Vreelandella titanicae]|uniref:hypothetical protein n=1 Tax=Vreelandella titanicae TaxID=664683 RepID=UPI001143961E|nr:hypothetical protein [Halomonas titanicae]
MKITGKIELDSVADVVCDVCLCSTRGNNDGLEFATLQTHWGYGTMHDGERYEIHLCESCFILAVSNLKQERRIQNLFSDDEGVSSQSADDGFGLVAKDDYFRDNAEI